MELTFEHIQQVTLGNSPDTLHYWDNEAQVLYLKDGQLYGKITNTPYGAWDNRTFGEEILISPDSDMEYFKVDSISEFGAFGSYLSGDTHKMIIYEFQFSLDEHLNSGSIKHSIDSPIASFTLQLENPKDPNPEHLGNVAISEEGSLLSPGAKVVFKFSAGDEEPYEMGVFYVDRSNFKLLAETVSVDGRNIIGKALKDQTFDEEYTFSYGLLNTIITNILLKGNISNYKILVEAGERSSGYRFDPNMDLLSGLEEIFKATLNWKIDELVDGTVVAGSPTYSGFVPNSRYEFQRDKDIFSRDIVRDDLSSYRRVCVHNSDFTIAVYNDVEVYSGWNLQSNKTLYVSVPNGTSLTDATEYAAEIATRLASVGKIESFTGPFRPHLLTGDEAIIINENKSTELGLITEVTQRFGKRGFYTDFTVDSGGRLGKGRLTDYINQVTREKTSDRMYE